MLSLCSLEMLLQSLETPSILLPHFHVLGLGHQPVKINIIYSAINSNGTFSIQIAPRRCIPRQERCSSVKMFLLKLKLSLGMDFLCYWMRSMISATTSRMTPSMLQVSKALMLKSSLPMPTLLIITSPSLVNRE